MIRFLCKSILYGAFVWARRALNGRKCRFPARAVLYLDCAAVESRAEALRTAPGVHEFIARCRVDLDEDLLSLCHRPAGGAAAVGHGGGACGDPGLIKGP